MATTTDQGVVRITSDFGMETVNVGGALQQANNPVGLFGGGGAGCRGPGSGRGTDSERAPLAPLVRWWRSPNWTHGPAPKAGL